MPAKQPSPQLLPADLYDLTAEDQQRAADEQALGMTSPQDPVLAQVCKAVQPQQIGSSQIQTIIDRLFAAAGAQQQNSRKSKKRRMLVGLAASQVGEPLRIIVVDTRVTADRKRAGQLECFINPQIVWRSRETEEGREGCFSAGPVWGLVRRPLAVKIRALTPAGKSVERILEGFTARIMQHEIDHLNGIRFPDRIQSDKKRHWVHAEELPLYSKHVNHWPRQCSRQRWEDYKGQGS